MVEELLAENDVEAQIEEETREGRSRTGAGRERKRHCKSCGEAGHNSGTGKEDNIDNKE